MSWLERNDWPEEEAEAFKELMFKLVFANMTQDFIEEAPVNSQEPRSDEPVSKIPDTLPILPLRGLVVYPETAVPLTIGQPRSIRLIDDVVAGENRLIGLIASRDPELEIPEPKDLFTTGTVGMVHRLFRAPDSTIRLLVQGVARFKVVDFIQTDPYLKANIQLIPETVETGLEIEALARNARDQFAHIAEMIPTIPRSWLPPCSRSKNPCRRCIPLPIFSAWIWMRPRAYWSWIRRKKSCTS